jgi:hypothetical protein
MLHNILSLNTPIHLNFSVCLFVRMKDALFWLLCRGLAKIQKVSLLFEPRATYWDAPRVPNKNRCSTHAGAHLSCSMTLLHSSSPSLVEQENIDTEFEATIHDNINSPEEHEMPVRDDSEADVSSVMQQHQQVSSHSYSMIIPTAFFISILSLISSVLTFS